MMKIMSGVNAVSVGLSDLKTFRGTSHSPALCFGLCWYLIAPSELTSQIRISAPKERFDISIVRRAMNKIASYLKV